MHLAQTLRRAATILVSWCLLCVPTASAGASPGGGQDPATLRPLRAISPDTKRAAKAIERGEKAEVNGRFEEALTAYDEALRYSPQDTKAAEKEATLRSRLVRDHVDNAERLGLDGHIVEATEELQMAMHLDPTNHVVAERIAQMQAMNDDKPVPPPTHIEGLPRLKVQDGKHDFDLRGDTRTAYLQVARTYGIKATFDPDLPSRNVRMRVEGVDFKTAMSLLGEQTGTFYRPVDGGLIFVVADTAEKHREYGVQAEQTFMLPAAVAPEEMTELLRVLREMTGSTHVELDSQRRSITMRDSLERLQLAGELIRQAEKAHGEVMLEVELLEVDKDKARSLGIMPPASNQAFLVSPNDIRALTQANDVTNALTIVGQLFSAQGFSSVPGFTTVGGGNSTFLLTLPGTTANFSDALTLVQSGRQVLMRAQDGKPATFFVGDRFPVTLSLLSGSLGTGTGTGIVGAVPTSTTFPETSFAVGNNPVALAAANYSSGTLPDLAVVNQNDNSISILLNQDNGNFVPQANSPFVLAKTERGPIAITSGSFGNTATLSNGVEIAPVDLVIANATSNNVTVLLGNGDGTFFEAPGSPYAVGSSPSSIVVADFNGDGNLDFAVTNRGDNTISVFKGNGSGGFTQFPSSPFALTNTTTISEKGPLAMAATNFRNTTITTASGGTLPEVDLAIVNETSNNVTLLLGSIDNNGNVTFTEPVNSPIAVGQSPVALAVSDLNTDGIPDLAVVNQGDNSISILLGSENADATFSVASGSPLATATTPVGIAIANFTGGQVPSLAVTNQGTSTLGVYVGLGGGTFSSRLEIATPATPSAIISSTLTSSGLPDVALTALGTTANQGLVAIIQDSSAFAAGATPTQVPYPGSEYIDLGVKVKATPTVHTNNEVTLQLEFEIRALSGNNINGIPIISNRTLSQTVRVKEGQTSLISGLLDQEETRAITGLPGFADIPGASYLFSTHNNSLQDTEFLILVTPRKLRSPVRSAPAIFAGRGDAQQRGIIGAGAPPEGPPPPPPQEPPPLQQPQQQQPQQQPNTPGPPTVPPNIP